MDKLLYRYDGHYYSTDNYGLTCSIYKILRETKCGYWVHIISPYILKDEKWVSKAGKKRLCYPTKIEALTSLYHRRKMHIKILNNQIKQSGDILNSCKKLKLKMEKDQNDFINNNSEF